MAWCRQRGRAPSATFKCRGATVNLVASQSVFIIHTLNVRVQMPNLSRGLGHGRRARAPSRAHGSHTIDWRWIWLPVLMRWTSGVVIGQSRALACTARMLTGLINCAAEEPPRLPTCQPVCDVICGFGRVNSPHLFTLKTLTGANWVSIMLVCGDVVLISASLISRNNVPLQAFHYGYPRVPTSSIA